jgi:hypothetical protein
MKPPCRYCGRARCRSLHGGRMKVRATKRVTQANYGVDEDEVATPTDLPAIIERLDMVPQNPCRTWWLDPRTKSKTYGFVLKRATV